MPSEQQPSALTQEPERGAFIFFSYAHRDKWLRDELEKHLSNLKYRGLIDTWHDQEIRAGEEWAHQIDIYLNKAHIILLLISADFMASEYCYGWEMKRALERHQQRDADVIPILLRPVLFTDAPFAKLQILPTNGKPVMQWQSRDSAFVDIAYGIERVARKYLLLQHRKQHDEITKQRWGWANYASLSVPLNRLKVIRESLLSPLPIGIFVFGLIVTGIFALLPHSNAILLAIVSCFSLLISGIVAIIRANNYFHAINKNNKSRGSVRSSFSTGEETYSGIPLFIDIEDDKEYYIEYYYEKAIRAYHSALYRNPSDGDALRGLGNALYTLEYYDKALDAFQRAIRHDPTASTYAGLTNVLAKLQRHSEALAAYEKAIELDSTVTFNYEDLIQSLLALDRREYAEQVREKAKQFGYYQDDDL